MLLRKEWALLASCSFVSCVPATRAAFIPQLDLGLRSTRTSSAASQLAEPNASAKRWDVTLFARLSWRSRRAPDLYPTAATLAPERWDAVCVDELNCLWSDPEETSLKPYFEAEP